MSYFRPKLVFLAALTALSMGLLAGCLEAPSDSGANGNPNSLSTCDRIYNFNPGGIYRVQGNSLGLIQIKGDLNMPWEAYVDPATGALYFTEDGTGDCTGSIKRISDPINFPSIIVDVVNNVDRPRRPVVFEGYIYFTEYKANGSVSRVKLSNGKKQQIISGLNRPFGIAVDSNGPTTWVYFTEVGNGNNGTVKKIAITQVGGIDVFSDPTTLAMDLKRPIGIQMDAFYVFVSEMEDRVFRFSKADLPAPGDLPVQDDLLTGLTTPYPPVLELTVLGPGFNNLYFADFANKVADSGRIYRLGGVDGDDGTLGKTPIPLDVADCDGTTPAPECDVLSGEGLPGEVDSLSWPMLAAMDSTDIYWTEVFSSSVKKVPKAGGATEEIVTGDDIKGFSGIESKPLGIAAHEYDIPGQGFLPFVFFTDLGNNECCF